VGTRQYNNNPLIQSTNAREGGRKLVGGGVPQIDIKSLNIFFGKSCFPARPAAAAAVNLEVFKKIYFKIGRHLK
jgi:hypothetical protein